MHRGVTLSGMRLFIGIALSPEASDALRSVRIRFEPGSADLRWSQPESWHVTLQFLGSTTEAQFACVQEKLAAVKAAKVPVRIAGVGFTSIFEEPEYHRSSALRPTAYLFLFQAEWV